MRLILEMSWSAVSPYLPNEQFLQGWYINNDILALLNDQRINWTSDDYYEVYFPDKNWSILEIRNASKSFEVGCGSSSIAYDVSMVIVLEGKCK